MPHLQTGQLGSLPIGAIVGPPAQLQSIRFDMNTGVGRSRKHLAVVDVVKANHAQNASLKM